MHHLLCSAACRVFNLVYNSACHLSHTACHIHRLVHKAGHEPHHSTGNYGLVCDELASNHLLETFLLAGGWPESNTAAQIKSEK